MSKKRFGPPPPERHVHPLVQRLSNQVGKMIGDVRYALQKPVPQSTRDRFAKQAENQDSFSGWATFEGMFVTIGCLRSPDFRGEAIKRITCAVHGIEREKYDEDRPDSVIVGMVDDFMVSHREQIAEVILAMGDSVTR
mgnify:CR=1 FL=1